MPRESEEPSPRDRHVRSERSPRRANSRRSSARTITLAVESCERRLALDATGMIDTVDDFRAALATRAVREVSPELVGLFPTAAAPGSPMYPEGISRAWLGSSDDLFSLLVLNRRDPAPVAEPGPGTFTVSQKTIDGMARIVGFPFPEDGRGGRFSAGDLSLAIFRKEDASPAIAGDAVPTFARFFRAVNELRPEGSRPLPPAVLQRLEKTYRGVASGEKTPLQAFAALSGMSAARLVDLGFERSVGYDVVTNPVTKRSEVINRAAFAVYRRANEAIGPYYTAESPAIPSATGVGNFFRNFADPERSMRRGDWVGRLSTGFRALLALSFDASPLFTSLGVGYSDVVNPFVGRPLAEQRSGLPIYVGQEFVVPNGMLPTAPPALLVVRPAAVTGGDAAPQPAPWMTAGFFALDAAVRIGRNTTVAPPAGSSFTWSGSVREAGVAVRFAAGSVTSDTVSSRDIVPWDRRRWLTGTSTVTVGGRSVQLRTLPELASAVLPPRFATYAGLGGGIDSVTGSRFPDVIVGPSLAGVDAPEAPAFHGRISIDAGAGDDVVEPGRGAGVVLLGTGRDTVVVGGGDLFGRAILLDFRRAHDRVVVDGGFVVRGFGTDSLVISDTTGAMKTLVLAGASDATWNRESIVTVVDAGPSRSIAVHGP